MAAYPGMKSFQLPECGQAKESFVVNGRRFEYSDYTATAEFNHARSHGGPMREGIHVRIARWEDLLDELRTLVPVPQRLSGTPTLTPRRHSRPRANLPGHSGGRPALAMSASPGRPPS